MTNARLEELRAKFQENPRRYFAPFANELRKAGDPAQAISVCRAHLAGQPGHVSGHIVLGQALYENGEAGEARDVFTAALELDPENLIALRTLGEIAQVNGEFTTARQWYERLLEADPRNNEVNQLLKDMPAEAPPVAPVAPLVELEQPTPFTVQQEIQEKVAEPEEAPRSTFHTSFTGSQRAYGSSESETPDVPAESSTAGAASELQSPERDSEAFIDLEPSAHQEQVEAPGLVEPPVMTGAEAESIDMVDFDAMPSTQASEVMPASPSPDESFAPFEAFETPHSAEANDSAAELPDESSQQVVAEEFSEAEMADTSFAATSEHPSSDESTESPRAMFAERGFDGPINEDLGWMTTPSATFSDPEAAPEEWFDPIAADAEQNVSEPPAEANVPVEMSQPDHATDSWFDDVEGVSAIESTEVTTDELWLPPELPSFGTTEDATPPAQAIDELPVEAEASAQGQPAFEDAMPDEVSAFRTPDEMVNSESSSHEAVATSEPLDLQPEPYWMLPEVSASMDVPAEAEPVSFASEQEAPAEAPGFDVHAMADAADEAFVVEHPAEASSTPAHDDTLQPMVEAETPVESMSMEADVEIINASANVPPVVSEGVGHSPEAMESESSVPPAPFITETLADLYLQQGFRDEALSIFRQLVAREPENQALRDRIAAIEKGDEPQTPQASEIPVEERASSQSVRTFFSRLARRPAVLPGPETSANIGAPSVTPDVPFAAAASALANLFSASRPQASDEGAASTLAGAFNDPSGRPSRAADKELSLDHLFRDVPPGGSPTGGVTLDEFYSTPNVAQGSPTESDETGAEESGGTDIRQFTAWLEGLRKK